MQPRRHAHAGSVQYRWPEQPVEVDDVFAEEVVQFGVAVRIQERIKVDAAFFAQRLEAGEVADRRIQPHIEKLARRIGNREAEVRRIARDVPVAQTAVEPLAQFCLDPGMGDRTLQPIFEDIGELRQLKKIVLRFAKFRRRTRNHRTRITKLGRGIGRTAVLAVVAVLVGRATVGAGPLDVAIGQEHRLDRIVQLGNGTLRNRARGEQATVDQFDQGFVLSRVGRVVVIERDPEFDEIGFVSTLDRSNVIFRRESCFFGRQHDRRAMCIVGADEMGDSTVQALCPHPNVGLDIAQQVAKVQRTVGVGQGGGD